MADRDPAALIAVRALDMAYGDVVVQHDIEFTIAPREVFIIMGGSGTGKSTLLRHMIGLHRPARGEVLYDGESFWGADADRRMAMARRFGVLFQSGALWSSMTLAENVALPLAQYSTLSPAEIDELARLKLALVGLQGFEASYPSEISGGMRKRAGLARAIALDPDILFFDEPSAGLDPVNARRLDELILDLRDNLGATAVVVTHDLASIFLIGDNAVFLDAESRTVIARGNPRDLLRDNENPRVQDFLRREAGMGAAGSP